MWQRGAETYEDGIAHSVSRVRDRAEKVLSAQPIPESLLELQVFPPMQASGVKNQEACNSTSATVYHRTMSARRVFQGDTPVNKAP